MPSSRKTYKIQPSLAEVGQTFITDASAAQRANRRMLRALAQLPALGPSSSAVRLAYLHVGSGPYAIGEAVSEHQHDQLQIQTCVSGRFVFTAGDHACDLRPGQTCLIEAKRPHRWRCTQPGILLGGLLDPASPRGLSPKLTGANDTAGLVGVAIRDEQVLLAELMQACAARSGNWSQEQARFALGLWLSRVLQQALIVQSSSATHAHARSQSSAAKQPARSPTEPGSVKWGQAAIARAVAFMQANLGKHIAVADVANEAGLSERHLARLFREHEGVSVAAYLADLRLDRAHQMLTNDPHQPLKAIALACGFRQPGYFSRCYRQRFGQPPSAAR